MTVIREQAPVRLVLHLAIITLAVGLPGLIEGLEVEDINTPVEHAADSALVVLLGVLGAGLSRAVVSATIYYPVSFAFQKVSFCQMSLTRGPASFTSGELNLIRLVAGDLLDVVQGLEHIIEIGVGGIVELLALPVREAIGEAIICTSVN